MKLSPFPGMDPFLEDKERWSSVHARLIVSISDLLTEKVSPRYFVNIEERVYVLAPDETRERFFRPDLIIVQSPKVTPRDVSATLITPATLVEPVIDEEVHDRYIEIVDSSDNTVVTTIEILSPANKQGGTTGRHSFVDKRIATIGTTAHWIEIDLLRLGERFREVENKSHYYALLKRAGIFGAYEVWYNNLQEQLPVIAIPLRSPDPDVPLALQAALNDVYYRGRYADKLDYTKPVPGPRLNASDAAWVQEQISKWMVAQPNE